MKNLPWIRSSVGLLLLGAILLLQGCSQSNAPAATTNSTKGTNDVTYYTCSMHPQIRSEKPGRCPICGMDLVAVRMQSAPSQTSPQPEKQERKLTHYTCSMHAQIHSDHPGKCPICGMDLIPVYDSVGRHESIMTEVRLTEEGIRQAAVRTEEVQKRRLSRELLIFGTLGYDLNQHRDIVPLVEGRIEKQFVDFNQTEVKRGDPLVSIYSTEALKLQEEYLRAVRDRWMSTFYERELLDSVIAVGQERLERIGFTPEDLERLKSEKTAKPEVIIRSPISGSIVGNMVHIGELAKIDQVLYHIVPLDELWFNGQVFEPDLGLLRTGQKVRLTTKSFPGETFPGTLSFISRAIDTNSRTVPVRFTVPNKDHRLLPNLSATGNLEIPLGEQVLSVPNSAILDLGTRHVVYIRKESGLFVQRNVRIGTVTTHYTQILEGLEDGETIVSAGAFLIDAQAQLRSAPATSQDASQPTIPPSTTSQGHTH